MKGLGVDQVVAFTMVTANGSIVFMEEDGKIIKDMVFICFLVWNEFDLFQSTSQV